MKITLPDHVIAGKTPGYQNIEVVDLDDGAILTNVVEANVKEGWIIYLAHDKQGRILVVNGSTVPCREDGSYELRWAA